MKHKEPPHITKLLAPHTLACNPSSSDSGLMPLRRPGEKKQRMVDTIGPRSIAPLPGIVMTYRTADRGSFWDICVTWPFESESSAGSINVRTHSTHKVCDNESVTRFMGFKGAKQLVRTGLSRLTI